MKFVAVNDCVYVGFKVVERDGKPNLNFVTFADSVTYENIEGFCSDGFVSNRSSFVQGDRVKVTADISGKFVSYNLEKIK